MRLPLHHEAFAVTSDVFNEFINIFSNLEDEYLPYPRATRQTAIFTEHFERQIVVSFDASAKIRDNSTLLTLVGGFRRRYASVH